MVLVLEIPLVELYMGLVGTVMVVGIVGVLVVGGGTGITERDD